MRPTAAMLVLSAGCTVPVADDSAAGGTNAPITVVTFNTGTTESMGHDNPPYDGYTSDHAVRSDAWYGDGLAWLPAVHAATEFFAVVQPDVIAFQEIFHADGCVDIPEDQHADFICDNWTVGDPTVASQILAENYQVVCHPGKDDKCIAVNRDLGAVRGCEADFCLQGLTGFGVDGCGSGARVAMGDILDDDGEVVLTVVSVHGTSGLSQEDQNCRVAQVEQVFTDLGDGQAGVRGDRNLVLGDFNTDPHRFIGMDDSAVRWNDFVGGESDFQFITDVGPDAPLSYQGIADIDHVISDTLRGACWHAGLDGYEPVMDAVYFDHLPAVCVVE